MSSSRSVVHCVSTQYAMAGVVDPANWQDNRGGSNKNFFMNIVRELPKHGHEVLAFGPFPRRVRLHDVEWCPLRELDRHGKPDVLWACYDVMPLLHRHGMLRIGSHHTYKIDRCQWEFVDVNTAPSQSAVDELRRRYAPHSEWEVQPNAVEDDLLPWRPVPGRVIYHTSQDRGLRLLLRVWPEIRARVPGATLHIIAGLHPRDYRPMKGTEEFVDAVRLRELQANFDAAVAAGGVTHVQNVPRAHVLRELQEASCFAFPVSSGYACETFSVSAMECCRMGIPVVMAPQDALESIYRGSVLLTPAPADDHLDAFADGVVQVLTDPVVAARLSASGKKLAEPYTYANAGKALSDIICARTGFVPRLAAGVVVTEETPEVRAEAARPKVVREGGKRIAFLLDPRDCGRPINPERILTDARGLTGTDVTSFQLAVEMGRRGHDVTWFTNLTHDHEGRGIRFARYEHWEREESAQRWDAAVATLSPRPLAIAKDAGLRVLNEQVNDFANWPGWEKYVDVVTALSKAHEAQLRKHTTFDNWRTLPNGVDPSVFHEGDRNNRKMVWASSPDRGLHWLLELFPRLKKAVPDVTLDVLYMYLAGMANETGEVANRYRYMNTALTKLSGHGVHFHGSVSRQRVVEAFSTSRVLAYTCHPDGPFTEGFSCTTLEAAVAGCLPVIVGADALAEIYGAHVPCVPAPYPAHKQEYFDLLVRALTDDDFYFAQQAEAKKLADLYSWKAVGDRLEAILGFAS
jgi:glycosyltransferase involved in cell wall biosynthesis